MSDRDRERASAWLCIMRYNFAMGCDTFFLPPDVTDRLLELGLVEGLKPVNRDGEECVSLEMTERGHVFADVNAADWWIDAIGLPT